jgi:predicted O-linked N-acetylglucosamine transferase (SPINDLY family)
MDNRRTGSNGKQHEEPCAQGKATDCASARVSELVAQAFAHYQNGQFRESKAAYEQVLRWNPEQAEALCFLGVIAHREGRNELALDLIARAIAKDPSQSVFHLNLGTVLEAIGNRREAIVSYRQAIALDPGCAPALSNLGDALLKEKLWPEAASNLVKALEFSSKNHLLANSLGIALEKMGRLEQSVVCFRKALSLRPDFIEAHLNLGDSLSRLGFKEEGIATFRRAVALNPSFYRPHCYLGAALYAVGQNEPARKSCETALQLRPNAVDADLDLGNLYKDLGWMSKAVECYRRVVALNASSSAAYNNLGLAYMEMGALKDARESYERALELSPGSAVSFSGLLFFHASMRDISPEDERALAENWEKCALSEAERLAARTRASKTGGAFVASPRKGRRLRIGVVTAELGSHAVAYFLEPFLEELDKERFHLTFFPTVAWAGARTERMVALGDGLISLAGVPHAQAAERIRAEQVDILMDTTGHTENCHLGIFAHRAAPVQLTYAGYWSTTGLTEMDWVLADPTLPSECDRHFSEGVWRLPRLASCYHGDAALPESRWEPGAKIWLGSFNKYTKIRQETLALWARVLLAIPGSMLLLEDRRAHEEETHQRILATLASHGIAADRIEFVPAIFYHDRHMALYDRLDVALDTIPFNSGTTGFDALWMGVPLVALEGDWGGGRIASSALKALGREEWIAQSEDEYVSIVRDLVENVKYREQIRKTQRARMVASPMCDSKGMARAFEGAFEGMYDRWLDG